MANPAVKDLEERWNRQLAEFDRRLNAMSVPSSPTLEQLAEEFRAFKDMVRGLLQVLQRQLTDSTKALDAMDMRQRRKILLLNGIPEDSEKTEQQKVLHVIQNQLGLSNVNNDCIKRCHRLGAQSNDRVRSILVHFHDHQIKAEVWKSKSKLKGSNFSMSEFLTKTRQSIHKKARSHFHMKNVWTLDGVIYIKTPGGERVKIVSEEELDKLLSKYPQSAAQPLSSCSEQTAEQCSGRQPEAGRKPETPMKQNDEAKRPRRAAQKK